MHVCLLFALLSVDADAPASRYGIVSDLTTFPQKSPQETLSSVLKAAEAKRFDYLAAQLADPAFVDDRVHRLYAGQFTEQVDDTRTRLDAPTVVLLRRYLKDGTWQLGKDTATVLLKDNGDRLVAFRLVSGRWYMENRNK